MLLGGRVAGLLRRGRAAGAYAFEYAEAWRDDMDAYALSLSLPLAGRLHQGPALGHYLRGLLPDSETRLNVIAHRFGVSPGDTVAILANIGEDCPGAVQFASPSRAEDLLGEGRGRTEWLSDSDVAELLRGLSADDAQGDAVSSVGQFSLPGALPKTALALDPARLRWGLPSGRAATTHILKPPLRGVAHHNENEHLCLELARTVGLSAAASFLVRIEDQSAIAVERFDRVRHGSRVHRVHHEDLSQALGVNPRLKYHAEGAPGIADAVSLLRAQSSRSVEDAHDFLRAVAFNWIIAGTDAHPRNYSLSIRARGVVALAPLYDLASALLLPTRTPVADLPFAMRVAGQATIGAITNKAWVTQARSVRLDPDRVLADVHALAVRIPDAVSLVAAAGIRKGVDAAFAKRFASRVGRRADGCARDTA